MVFDFLFSEDFNPSHGMHNHAYKGAWQYVMRRQKGHHYIHIFLVDKTLFNLLWLEIHFVSKWKDNCFKRRIYIKYTQVHKHILSTCCFSVSDNAVLKSSPGDQGRYFIKHTGERPRGVGWSQTEVFTQMSLLTQSLIQRFL